MEQEAVAVNTPTIQLDQFLKWAQAAESGGQAKQMIDSGLVKVNQIVVQERRKKLHPGDVVAVQGIGAYKVVAD